jgi:hypothetical protein
MEFTKFEAKKWIEKNSCEEVKVHPHEKNSPHLDCIRNNLMYSRSKVEVNGAWLEFGVKNGSSFEIIRGCMPDNKMLHGFDVWTGLPEPWLLRETYPAGILKSKRIPKDTTHKKYWTGLFKDTIPLYLEKEKDSVAFCHVDGDLYSSACDVLWGLNDRIVTGTIIVFDELHTFEKADTYKWYNVWNGELRALAEWCQEKERKVEMFSRTEWMQGSFRVIQ